MARHVFRDAFAIDWFDKEHSEGEERYGVIGMMEGRLLFVAYAIRGERMRIISARKAEPYKRRKYHDENRESLLCADGRRSPRGGAT
jgi:uncharacterized DUF497 family protein